MTQTLKQTLENLLRSALDAAGLPADAAAIAQTADPSFGDYQSNTAMALAKARRENPRALATRIAQHFPATELCPAPEIAGPGFLNFRLRNEALAALLPRLAQDPHLGTPPASPRKTIIIDFSSPNVAKPMHVGHIRSTVIGDCLARTARFLGHHVVTDNHLGDWGTQFGKILHGWKTLRDDNALAADPIAELVRIYREVTAREASDPQTAAAARAELVRLQQGEPENLAIWRRAVELSWQEFQKIYDLLDVRFDEHLGESFYNDRLAPLVQRLLDAGIATISEGAACIFFPGIPGLEDKPCLIRKSDGGFLYATTDLATLEYRWERWRPDAIWYVTGAPQALHFRQVFEAARLMGIPCELRHIPFGSILGEDRKMMKTRAGDNVPLAGLLEEAIARASRIVAEKNPDLPAEEAAATARAIGIGAVKYAELSQHRMTDYIFSWDKMLSFQGNTAPYLQNAYVRIRSILRRCAEDLPSGAAPAPGSSSSFEHPSERALALKLLQFGEAVPEVLDDFRPNLLATFLFELATAYHHFYESCPVLKAPEPLRSSRLLLCELCARTLRTGLDLMGISCPERM